MKYDVYLHDADGAWCDQFVGTYEAQGAGGAIEQAKKANRAIENRRYRTHKVQWVAAVHVEVAA